MKIIERIQEINILNINKLKLERDVYQSLVDSLNYSNNSYENITEDTSIKEIVEIMAKNNIFFRYNGLITRTSTFYDDVKIKGN